MELVRIAFVVSALSVRQSFVVGMYFGQSQFVVSSLLGRRL